MMSRILLFTLAACATALSAAACGGAVEQPNDGTIPTPASTLKSANSDATPWGVWDLVSLEREGSIAMQVHDVLQLDVRPGGSVIVRRCGKQYYEPGTVSMRCGDEASYDCYYGTVSREGADWRIDLPDLPTSSSREERTIETVVAGEQIKIRYIMPKSEAGVFQRTADDMRTTTSSSYTVGNCKSAGGG